MRSNKARPKETLATHELEDAMLRSKVAVYAGSPAASTRLATVLRGAGFDNLTFIVEDEAFLGLVATLQPDLLIVDPTQAPPSLIRDLEPVRRMPEAPAVFWVESETVPLTSPPAWSTDRLILEESPEMVQLRITRALLARQLRAVLAADRGPTPSNRSFVGEGGAPVANYRRMTDLERGLLDSLARVSEFRVDAHGTHARRVGEISATLAMHMEMGEPFCELLQQAAPLHDVGTIGVPDSILTKNRRLDAEESSVMKLHTSLGLAVLGEGSDPIIEMARRIAVGHHERWDGLGYPNGLTGTDIPIEARIVAVADSYEALSRSHSSQDALDAIVAESGKAFDPRVVGALVRLVDRVAA